MVLVWGEEVVERQLLFTFYNTKTVRQQLHLACTPACRNNVKSHDNTCQHHNHLDKLEHFHSMFHRSDRNV